MPVCPSVYYMLYVLKDACFYPFPCRWQIVPLTLHVCLCMYRSMYVIAFNWKAGPRERLRMFARVNLLFN